LAHEKIKFACLEQKRQSVKATPNKNYP